MKDLLELAAKCRNPIVRNAILANAVLADDGTRATRLVDRQLRRVRKEWADEGDRYGEAFSRGRASQGKDPGWLESMRGATLRFDAENELRKSRLDELERAGNALRIVRAIYGVGSNTERGQ